MVELSCAAPFETVTAQFESASSELPSITIVAWRPGDNVKGQPAHEWPPRPVTPLPVWFSEGDIPQITQKVGIPISSQFQFQAAASLTHAFSAFDVQSRALAKTPIRRRGKPREHARSAFLRACLLAYWQITMRPPNYRDAIGEKTKDAPAVKFVREVTSRGVGQLQRSSDPWVAAMASALDAKLLKISPATLAHLIGDEIPHLRPIVRKVQLTVSSPRGRPPGGADGTGPSEVRRVKPATAPRK